MNAIGKASFSSAAVGRRFRRATEERFANEFPISLGAQLNVAGTLRVPSTGTALGECLLPFETAENPAVAQRPVFRFD
jgi:hypothetical protein